MNRVYKVIWSKAKHCYVVTSEIAKGYGKSAGSKGVKALLSGLVALSIAMGGYGMAGAVVYVDSKAASEGMYTTDVYTKTETDAALNGKANTATTLAGYGITNAYTKTAVNKRIAAEAAARKQADQNNLKIDEHGVVTMVKDDSNQDVNKLVLKVDGDNQITMDKDGIQVGKNNIVIGSDGTIKGANERFSVGTDGKVTAASGIIGTVDITSAGAVSGVTDLTVSGNVEAVGNLKVGNGNFTVNGITGDVTTGNATIGGDLGVNGNIKTNRGFIQTGGGNINTQGGALRTNGGNINAGNGLIQTTGTVKAGKVQTRTLKTTGKAEIGGNLTVDKNLTVNGTFDSKTLSSELDKNNYTTINGGKTQSVNLKVDAVGTETQASASTFDENGSNAWAKDDDSIGKSTVTADGISQKLSDTGDNPTVYAERTMSQGTDEKYSMVDTVKDGDKTNVASQTASESSSVVSGKDGKNSYNSYITQNMKKILQKIEDGDGNVLTSTEQTETDITNEAKNKITNKALDVETDAASSIVSKVSNDYGSNTSTQLSHQTTEEMKAEGKTASYLRGAAEEKSQLTDGAKKTTIDTVAGQTNTNITEGKNVSNSLQEADKIASSVTDGTNTTAVNQDARSLASSITDGPTKFNNSFHWVDGSAQRIEVDDTHFYAETRTAETAVETLKSGKTQINIVKDTNTATVSSAVNDDETITGVTQTAKDITNTAEKGTIANNAKDITNNATENMTNTVGKDLTTTVGGNETRTVKGTLTETVTGNVTEDYKANLDTKVRGNETHYVAINQTNTVSGDRTVNVKGTEKENFNAQVTNVKTNQQTSVGGKQTNIVGGDQQNTVSGSKTETVNKAVTEKYGSQATTVNGDQSTNVGGNQSNVVKGNQTNTISGSKTESVKGAVSETYGSQNTKVNGDQSTTVTGKQTNSITGDQVNTIGGKQTTTVTGDSSLSAKNITNTATTSITDKVGDNTSWKMTNGTVVESVKDASGKTNQTTTKAADTYQFVKDGDNTLAKRTSSTNDNLNITDSNNTYTKITTATGNKQTVTGGTETASTNLTKSASNTLIENETQSVLDHMAADTSYTVMNENGNGSRRQQTASEILDRVTDGTDTSEVKQTASEVAASAKDISNTATDKITSQIGDGSAVKSEMTADGITNITGNNTVTSGNGGTTFANKDAKTPFVKGGEVNTKITGNKVETGKVLTDDLTVRGTSEFVGEAHFRNEVYVDENLTVAKETRTDTLYVDHNGYVGGNLIVDGNIETHDAVLSADSRQVVTGRQLYQTNERVDRLDNRIKKVGANAAALAALRPGDFNPDDKFSIAAGFGSYRNANAAALGLFYRPNENVLLSLGTSFGDGENMVNAGVSVKFGRGKSMAERRKEMADEVSSMRDEMRSQDERIAELEEMLKKQSELIEKLSKES